MRVLVVEDVRRLADDIAEGLRDQGVAVDVTYDGLEGAAMIDVHAYDVVVLDRDLPGMHGDDLCQIITRRARGPMVLMLTASVEESDRVTGLSLGADDYLGKPFAFAELVLRVRALARRRPTAVKPIVRIGTIEIDMVRHRVTRGGLPVELSAREFAVLEALALAHPAPASAEALLERVWDANADPFTKAVHVTVSRLRRKLGDPDTISTMTGVGYVLRG